VRGTSSTAVIAALMIAAGAARAQTTTSAPVVAIEAAAIRPAPIPDRADPLERSNRAFFRFNLFLDRVLIRPIAVGYKRIAPRPIRQGVHNIIENLSLPVVFLNDVLQIHPKAAATIFSRFALNSTIGVVGVFDVATGFGAPHHDDGFGDTLGRYHTPPGPYLYVPVLGPSTVRDAFGRIIDALSDPLTWSRFPGDTRISVGRTVGAGLYARGAADKDLKTLYDTATDPYAYLRSVYLQNRQSEVQGGQVNLNKLPDFDEEPATPVGAAPAHAGPTTEAPNADPPPLPIDTAPNAASAPVDATNPLPTPTPRGR
jgi:phospholipid-binding lipoprotein MlaA